MTILWRYYDTSFFTSRQDGLKVLVVQVTLGPDFLISVFPRILSFKTEKFFQKSTKNHQKKFERLRPASPPYGPAPLALTKVGAKSLAAVVLAHHERLHSHSVDMITEYWSSNYLHHQ